MRVASEFSRFAHEYNQYNRIQQRVAHKLVSMVSDRPYHAILDLGCGRGEVYQNLIAQNIRFDRLHGIDISANMLQLHPKEERVRLTQGSFDHLTLDENRPYDLILSASALQWSENLDKPLGAIATMNAPTILAIFTANTFKTLHQTAGITSPIYPCETLHAKLTHHLGDDFRLTFETVEYSLTFDSTLSMLRYIKKSGTSGGERYMSYGETKMLLDGYPLDFLEFEVLFVEAIPKHLKNL